ncbi:hypothetical protein CYD94_21240 (plasmid) [Ralstonia solanacearum]|nr:hypothetical protein CYD94_21240 [Ralstonia solanacearum]
MRIIGFHGGSSLCELGTVSDVVLFFDCVRAFTAWKHPDRDWSLLRMVFRTHSVELSHRSGADA